MNLYVKILFVLGFMLFHKANAQLDTFQLLKKIDTNQKYYIGKSFSKLQRQL